MAERTQSPAYEALRASSRRLLLFIDVKIARHGGRRVTIYADQFAVVAEDDEERDEESERDRLREMEHNLEDAEGDEGAEP